MKILLTGVTGQVGHELKRELESLGNVIAPTRAQTPRESTPQELTPGESAPGKSRTRQSRSGESRPAKLRLDLGQPACLATIVRTIAPDWIVNAGAYTAVDAAESDAEQAHRVNAEAPGTLAAAAAEVGAAMVHFSTDYVFDGSASQPWRETDAPRPLSVYGQSKLEGERAVANATARYLVLRTSWVYGARGRNFALTMRDLAAAGRPLRVVADQHGSPTWSRSLAHLTGAMIRAAQGKDRDWWGDHAGVYHASAPDHTTWHAFAQHVVAATVGETAASAIEPIRTVDWPTPARRPLYSVLDTSLLRTRFGLELPPWRVQADGMLKVLQSS